MKLSPCLATRAEPSRVVQLSLCSSDVLFRQVGFPTDFFYFGLSTFGRIVDTLMGPHSHATIGHGGAGDTPRPPRNAKSTPARGFATPPPYAKQQGQRLGAALRTGRDRVVWPTISPCQPCPFRLPPTMPASRAQVPLGAGQQEFSVNALFVENLHENIKPTFTCRGCTRSHSMI